jgi:hypothetical protein
VADISAKVASMLAVHAERQDAKLASCCFFLETTRCQAILAGVSRCSNSNNLLMSVNSNATLCTCTSWFKKCQ